MPLHGFITSCLTVFSFPFAAVDSARSAKYRENLQQEWNNSLFGVSDQICLILIKIGWSYNFKRQRWLRALNVGNLILFFHKHNGR